VNELRDLPEIGELLLDRKGKQGYNSIASAEEVAALKYRRR
jgi:hypothetical protein